MLGIIKDQQDRVLLALKRLKQQNHKLSTIHWKMKNFATQSVGMMALGPAPTTSNFGRRRRPTPGKLLPKIDQIQICCYQNQV